MKFIKAQGVGLIVGLFVVSIWAFCDWLAQKHGWPIGLTRSYWDTLCAATSGAGFVAYFADQTTLPEGSK